jgi:hypothetical protein
MTLPALQKKRSLSDGKWRSWCSRREGRGKREILRSSRTVWGTRDWPATLCWWQCRHHVQFNPIDDAREYIEANKKCVEWILWWDITSSSMSTAKEHAYDSAWLRTFLSEVYQLSQDQSCFKDSRRVTFMGYNKADQVFCGSGAKHKLTARRRTFMFRYYLQRFIWKVAVKNLVHTPCIQKDTSSIPGLTSCCKASWQFSFTCIVRFQDSTLKQTTITFFHILHNS